MADPVPVLPVDPAPPPSDWRTGLTGDLAPLAQEKSLESFKGADWTEVGPQLAKAFVETKKLVGTKPSGLLEPGEKATPEERTAYQTELRKRLGVPDAPTQYQVKRPEAAIDSGWDAAVEAQFLSAMHAAGAPPAVVQAAIDFYGGLERTRLSAATQEAKAVEVKLRTEWGPNYDAMVGRANRAITEFGGADLEEALTNPASALYAASRHPAMVRAWAQVGTALVEHGAMSGEGYQTLSREAATERANEIRKQLQEMPEGDPRRMALVDEIIAVTRASAR